MLKRLATSALALTMTTALATAADQIDTRHYIYIEASASVSAKADRATIRIEFSNKNAKSADATGTSNSRAGQLLAMLKQIGVPDDNIDASTFRLDKVYIIALDKNGQPVGYSPDPDRDRFDGYRATRSVTVTLSDLSKIGAVLAAGVAAGGEVSDPTFFVSNEADLVLEAKQRAAEAALAKATIYTKAIGASLGDVLNIKEDRGYDPDTMESDGGGGESADLAIAMPLTATLPEPVPITIPTRTFSQSVSIKWEIAPTAK